MERRGFLGALAAAVPAAALLKNKPEEKPKSTGDILVPVVGEIQDFREYRWYRANEAISRGTLVQLDDAESVSIPRHASLARYAGVAVENAHRGQRIKVQVYGPYTIDMA